MASQYVGNTLGRQVYWDKKSYAVWVRKPGLLGGDWTKLPVSAASRSMALSVAYDWLKSRK